MPFCRLALVVMPRPGASALLDRALEAGDVATVFVLPSAGDDPAESETGDLVRLGQSRNVAVLVADDCDLCGRVGADGVHVTSSKDVSQNFRAARKTLGVSRLAGADAGCSRHDAMEIGEAGADYVAFGIPSLAQDREAAMELCLELVAWWSEIFAIPVVAFGALDEAEAHALASAGADFVAIQPPQGMGADAVAGWMSAVQSALQNAR